MPQTFPHSSMPAARLRGSDETAAAFCPPTVLSFPLHVLSAYALAAAVSAVLFIIYATVATFAVQWWSILLILYMAASVFRAVRVRR